MNERIYYCVKCGKAYYVTETGEIDFRGNSVEWNVVPLSPEYFTEIGEMPLTIEQIIEFVTTAVYTPLYGKIDRVRQWRIAAVSPFCPEPGCGGDLSETFVFG